MPSSFSRFLTEEELERVRQLYLESLAAEGLDAPDDADAQATGGSDGRPHQPGNDRG